MKSAKYSALRTRTRSSTSSTKPFAWKTPSTREKIPRLWWRTSKKGCSGTMSRLQNLANKSTHTLSICFQPRKMTNSTTKFSSSSAIYSRSRQALNKPWGRKTSCTGSTTREWTKFSTAAHQTAQKSTSPSSSDRTTKTPYRCTPNANPGIPSTKMKWNDDPFIITVIYT